MLIAQKLAARLEQYKPPRPYTKMRIGKVFLDVNEIPTASSLSEQITHSLDNSEFLIILCSPAYTQSRYCKAELDYFIATHNGETDRILTVLVEGEPSEVFPEALTGTQEHDGVQFPREPLGANVRADTDRRALSSLKKEFLRIAAPLLGLGYDDLYRRQIRRRRKRALTVCALAAAAGLLCGYGVLRARYHERALSLSQASADALERGDHYGALTNASDAATLNTWLVPPDDCVALALRNAAFQRRFISADKPMWPSVKCAFDFYEQFPTMITYLIPQSGTILCADADDRANCLLIDIRSGRVTENFALDRKWVDAPTDPRYLARVWNQKSEDGAQEQWFAVYDLWELRECFSVRLRALAYGDKTPDLRFGDPAPLVLTDSGAFVAAFDLQGARLTQAQAEQTTSDSQTADEPQRFTVLKSRRAYAVYNENNESVFSARDMTAYVFSRDMSLFAYQTENGGILRILDTDTWGDRYSRDIPLDDPSSVFLGADINPSLVCLTMRAKDAELYTGQNFARVYSLDNGQLLLEHAGTAHLLPDEPTVALCDGGELSVWQYNKDALQTAPYTLVRLSEQRGLYVDDRLYGDGIIIADTVSGKTLLSVSAPGAWCADERLSALCYVGDDASLRYLDASGERQIASGVNLYIAACRNGRCAALEGNDVVVWDALSGSELARIPTDAAPESILLCNDSVVWSQGKRTYIRALSPGGQTTEVAHGSCESSLVTADGLLLSLDRYAEQLNLAVIDEQTGALLYMPENNAAAFAYGEGLLARQLCSYSFTPTLTVQVDRRTAGGFVPVCSVTLPDFSMRLMLDETGRYLSAYGEAGTVVYDLQKGGAVVLRGHAIGGVVSRGSILSVKPGGSTLPLMDFNAHLSLVHTILSHSGAIDIEPK